MTTVEAIKLAVETLDRLAWDCDVSDNDEAQRLWEAAGLLVDIVDGRCFTYAERFGDLT